MCRMRRSRHRLVVALALMPLVSVGCSGDAGGGTGVVWLTESDFQFTDMPERDVVFRVPFVRADPVRDRVLVVDPPSFQVTTWALDGSLIFAVGRRGGGPGEFASPGDVLVGPDGAFAVLDGNGSRFTYFGANGDLTSTIQGPGTSVGYQGFRVALAWPEGGVHMGVPLIAPSVEVGTTGVRPFDRQPLLSVRRGEDGLWRDPEPVLWLDVSNRFRATLLPDDSWMYGGQPFADADQVRFAPGAAVVMRQKGPPGAVDLIEVNTDGDTLWHRQVQFELRKLSRRMIEEEVEYLVDTRAPDLASRVSRPRLRERLHESLYKPEYLPAVERFFLTASGEVWLRTHEVSDTLRVHHVVRRGDMGMPPRRVLLPESFRLTDATATHVWGIWRDALDVPHVVGRRLVQGPVTGSEASASGSKSVPQT